MDILNFNQYNEKIKVNPMTLSELDKIHIGSGFYNITNIDKSIKYALVFPYGGIEMFTEDGLANVINNWEGDEDDLITYEELQSLDKTGEWVSLSGPIRTNSDLDGTIGIKYF